MVLPLFSDGAPAGVAAATAAPDDAHEQALLAASSRPTANASSSATVITSSYTAVSSVSGTKPAPMPWDLVRARAPLGQHRRRGRLYGHNLHVGVHALEVRARAAHCAARAHARHEDIHVAAPVASQISGPVVASWTAGFAGFVNCPTMNELGISAASLGACDGAFHAQRAVGQHQLGAVGLREVGGTLDGHRLGHGYDQACCRARRRWRLSRCRCCPT